MSGYPVQLGPLHVGGRCAAQVGSITAPCLEGAAQRRIGRQGYLYLQSLAAAPVVRVEQRYRREQRLRVGVPYRQIAGRIAEASPRWIPATVHLREIRRQGYSGGITILRLWQAGERPKEPESPLIRFETPPGHQARVDWGQFRAGAGRLSAFVCVLGHSRYEFVLADSERLETLVEAHGRFFEALGGVPYMLLYDSMKTVIARRDAYGPGERRLNAGFREFARRHGFLPRLCRPRRAQTKGKAERFIRYLKESFYIPLEARLRASGEALDATRATPRSLPGARRGQRSDTRRDEAGGIGGVLGGARASAAAAPPVVRVEGAAPAGAYARFGAAAQPVGVQRVREGGMSDLYHERLAHLCESLNLPGVLDGYASLAAGASERGHGFAEFLEGVLRSERDVRRARSSLALVQQAGFPAARRWRSTTSPSRRRLRSVRSRSLLRWRLSRGWRTCFCWDLPGWARRALRSRWGFARRSPGFGRCSRRRRTLC